MPTTIPLTSASPSSTSGSAGCKEAKAGTSLHILNPRLALSEAQRQLTGRPARFPCLAGYKYWFVDWDLQVFRCHYLEESLGPLEDLGRMPPIRDNCNACAIDCYRDPSVYQYLAVSVADSLAALRKAKCSRAWAPCCTPTIFSPWPPCWRAATGCED